MNELIRKESKRILKKLLSECTEGQQLIFKRMYSSRNLELSISDAVDQMDDNKLDLAISQVERTVEKNKLS
jgi:hypothetical protein